MRSLRDCSGLKDRIPVQEVEQRLRCDRIERHSAKQSHHPSSRAAKSLFQFKKQIAIYYVHRKTKKFPHDTRTRKGYVC